MNTQRFAPPKRITALLKRITESPGLNFTVGVIFLLTGVSEAIDGLISEAESVAVGAHHGAMVFGLLHALKHLPDLFEGVEYLEKTTPDDNPR